MKTTMSTTHKIAELERRILELEERLKRVEGFARGLVGAVQRARENYWTGL